MVIYGVSLIRFDGAIVFLKPFHPDLDFLSEDYMSYFAALVNMAREFGSGRPIKLCLGDFEILMDCMDRYSLLLFVSKGDESPLIERTIEMYRNILGHSRETRDFLYELKETKDEKIRSELSTFSRRLNLVVNRKTNPKEHYPTNPMELIAVAEEDIVTMDYQKLKRPFNVFIISREGPLLFKFQTIGLKADEITLAALISTTVDLGVAFDIGALHEFWLEDAYLFFCITEHIIICVVSHKEEDHNIVREFPGIIMAEFFERFYENIMKKDGHIRPYQVFLENLKPYMGEECMTIVEKLEKEMTKIAERPALEMNELEELEKAFLDQLGG